MEGNRSEDPEEPERDGKREKRGEKANRSKECGIKVTARQCECVCM